MTSVTPTSDTAKLIDKFVNMVAASSIFQAAVGVDEEEVPATAAEDYIYLEDVPETIVPPFAIVQLSRDDSRKISSGATYQSTTTVELWLWYDVPEAYDGSDQDAIMDFLNRGFGTIQQINDASGACSEAELIVSSCTLHAPMMRPGREEREERGRYWVAAWSFDI